MNTSPISTAMPRPRSIRFVLNANTIWTDDLTFTASQNEEHINTPFFLPGGLVVPVGVYDNNGVKFRVQSSYVRPWGTTSEIEFKDFMAAIRSAMIST
jgi:hypothetical protein